MHHLFDVIFNSQLMSSRIHVGVKFLSPHAHIYESTHAPYDRTICTSSLVDK